MCLVTTEKIKVAEEDIIAYKSVTYIDEDSCISLFKYSTYTFGKTLTCPLGIKTVTKYKFVDANMFADVHGLCFADRTAMDYFDEIYTNKQITVRIVSEGFHSACSEHRLIMSNYESVIECVIPKGSNYIIDGSGLLVSDSIRAVKYVTRAANVTV